MNVILLEDIRGIGKKFDVKKVKDGYAKNFLIPRGIAERATAEALAKISSFKHALAEKEKMLKMRLDDIAKQLAQTPLMFSVKAGDAGRTFGSVGEHDIAEKISAMFPQEDTEVLQKIKPRLLKPIKTLGAHKVACDTGWGRQAEVSVILTALE